jgi:LysR family transcriptional regulator, hydrogen peroxide-inducible genes activator
VAEKQHFSCAATTLGVSQSTRSQALAALERVSVERGARRHLAQPAWASGVCGSASGSPGRLVFRSSIGRDEEYRRLAGIIGQLIGAEQKVRLLTR